MEFKKLQKNVIDWANDKGLLYPDFVKNQYLKTVSEVGELADAILKNDREQIIDGIGDVTVTLIILAEQLNLNLVDCLETAYNEIKHRSGVTKNGTFIKEE